MSTILVPVFNDRISSRLDCTECFKLVRIEGDEIASIEKLKIVAKNQFEKLKSIISLKPDAVICNGLTGYYENELIKNNIKVLSWFHGDFDDVVNKVVNGIYKFSWKHIVVVKIILFLDLLL